MFVKVKEKITELAKNAVVVAETQLKGEKGMQKKEWAVNYIVSRLPFVPLVREIISLFLSSFIDDAIETAVICLKSLPKNQGE